MFNALLLKDMDSLVYKFIIVCKNEFPPIIGFSKNLKKKRINALNNYSERRINT